MKIVKNYLYNLVYQVFILLTPLITVPYVARVIGPEGGGQNTFTYSVMLYFVMFGSLGIEYYGNRTIAYNREDKYQLSKNFFEIAILKFVSIGLTYLCFLIFLLFVKEYRVLYFAQSLYLVAAALDILWLFMGLEDFKKTVLRNVMVKIVSLIMVFTFVKSKDDLLIYILILSGSQVIGFLTLWGYLKKVVVKVPFKELDVLKHLKPAISFLLPQIAMQIYLVLNKTMLGAFSNMEELGYYEYADKVIRFTLAVVTASGTVMLPRVANTFAKGNHEKVKTYITTSFAFVSLTAFPIGFGIAGIAPKFVPWFLGSDFEKSAVVVMFLFPIIMMIGWSNVFGQQYLMPVNRISEYTASHGVGAAVSFLINLILIPLFASVGAAISTVVTEMMIVVTQLYFVRKDFSIKAIFKKIYKYFFSSFVMFLVVHQLNKNLPPTLLAFLIQIFIGALVYALLLMVLRDELIMNTIKKVKFKRSLSVSKKRL